MTIGIIGLGEVGSCYSSGLAEQGLSILGYDLLLRQPEFAAKEERCRKAGVEFTSGNEELVRRSDWVFAITTCAQTVETATIAAEFLRPGQIYVDFNSSIPSVKEEARAVVEATGADFCDACSVNTPLTYGLQNKIVMAGKRAGEVADYLNAHKMNIRNMGPEIGKAAAYKVIRSIYMKGTEALMLETIAAAQKQGILDEVIDSIVGLMEDDFRKTISILVRAGTVHSERRAHEVGDVAIMLDQMGLDNTMASAAYKKLRWYTEMGVKDHFHATIPDDLSGIADFMIEAGQPGK